MLNTTITASDLATARRVAVAAGVPDHAADDIVQDAVVAVLSGSFDASKGSMANYLAKTAKNLALNFHRRRCNKLGHDSLNATDYDREEGDTAAPGVILEGPDGRDVAERAEAMRAIREAVEAMPEADRRIVAMLVEGETKTVIAEALGLSNATITRRHAAIAEALRAVL